MDKVFRGGSRILPGGCEHPMGNFSTISKKCKKQECIPVGCIPPAHYCTGGGGVSHMETPPDRDPPDRDPPGQRPPWTETPWTETLHWTETKPWTETPCTGTP